MARRRRYCFGQIDGHKIRIILVPGEEGSIETFEDGGPPLCSIGRDQLWPGVVAVLTHELFEFCAMCRHLRYHPLDGPDRTLDGIRFLMTHEEFAVCAELAGVCLAGVWDAVREMWGK